MINIGFKQLDSFTGGFKEDDLIIAGIAGSIYDEKVLINIIRNVTNQNKKVLYISFVENNRFKNRLEELNGLAVCETDVIPDTNSIKRSCEKCKDMNLVIIHSFDSLFYRSKIYKTKENVYCQLKLLAQTIQTPIFATFSLRNNTQTVDDSIIRQYLDGTIVNNYEYIDNLIFFYQPNSGRSKIGYPIEAKAYDIKRMTERTAYMYAFYGYIELIEWDEKARDLLQNALSLGLNDDDAIEYVLYWSGKKSPEKSLGLRNDGAISCDVINWDDIETSEDDDYNYMVDETNVFKTQSGASK